MKKILVTGSAGFIGFHLYRRLTAMGYDVLGIDNLNNYYDVNLKLARLKECGFEPENIAYGRMIESPLGGRFCQLNLEDAAAMVKLSHYNGRDPFCDPFCGSGTLLIEAAQKAMNIAPGLKRRFAAERYSFVPAAVWAEQRQKALADSKLDVGFEAFGYDIDPAAVALANANAKLAGVGDRCRFETADVKDFRALDSATVLTNPPYGERLGDASEAAGLAKTLGQVWQAHPAQGLYAITADADFEQHFGKKAARRRKIYNGMIPCQLYMYFEQPKRERK